MVQTIVRLPADIHEALVRLARERGVSMAYVIREAITLYLAAQKNP